MQLHAHFFALAVAGGEQGTATSPPTWTYTVTDAGDGMTWPEPIDPTQTPHRARRSRIGQAQPANFGIGFLDADGKPVLVWVNEVPEVATP